MSGINLKSSRNGFSSWNQVTHSHNLESSRLTYPQRPAQTSPIRSLFAALFWLPSGTSALDYLRTPAGPPFGCDLPTWSYHVRPLVTVWGNPCSLSINNRESYRSPRRFQTIPQVGIKHFPQVAIKLDSNLWELLDSKLIPDTRGYTCPYRTNRSVKKISCIWLLRT